MTSELVVTDARLVDSGRRSLGPFKIVDIIVDKLEPYELIVGSLPSLEPENAYKAELLLNEIRWPEAAEYSDKLKAVVALCNMQYISSNADALLIETEQFMAALKELANKLL